MWLFRRIKCTQSKGNIKALGISMRRLSFELQPFTTLMGTHVFNDDAKYCCFGK